MVYPRRSCSVRRLGLAANVPECLGLELSGIDGRACGVQQEFECKIKDSDRTALCDKRSAVMGQKCAGVGLL